MDNLVDKFKQVKESIASLSEKKAKLEWQKEQKLLELKEKYGIITMEEAEEMLGDLAEKIETHTKTLQRLLGELEDIVAKAEKHESVEV